MDNYKIMSVKFLMNMFEGMYCGADGVKMFKANVNNLVSQGQIKVEVRDIIYNIYGVENSNTFYENRVANKLMQVKFLMSTVESMSNIPNGLELFRKQLIEQTRQGAVAENVKEIIFQIYDLSTTPSISQTVTPIPKTQQNKPETISKENLDIAYYRFVSSDDGCHRSYGYKKVTETPVRPVSSEIVYKTSDGDGCSRSPSFSSIPPAPPQKSSTPPISQQKPSSPIKSSNVDPCGRGFRSSGFRSSGC